MERVQFNDLPPEEQARARAEAAHMHLDQMLRDEAKTKRATAQAKVQEAARAKVERNVFKQLVTVRDESYYEVVDRYHPSKIVARFSAFPTHICNGQRCSAKGHLEYEIATNEANAHRDQLRDKRTADELMGRTRR